MKRVKAVALVLVLALSMLMLAGCGKSEFGVTGNTGKQMTISAKNAARDAAFMTGTLDVEEGEKVVMSAELEKGEIRVEIIEAPAGQDMSVLPDFDGEPILTGNLNDGESASGTMAAGSYMVRATCLEKATGVVTIDVQPADG